MYRLYRQFGDDPFLYSRYQSKSRSYLMNKANELHSAYCKLPKEFQIPNVTKITYIIKNR